MRVLVVEPDRRLTALFRAQLLAWGHLSTTVTTGTDGLAAVLQQTPDLVLLDPDIEDMTAAEFVASLGAIGDRMPPVVLVADEGAAPIWQVVGFVRKPVDPDALERVVAAFADDTALHAP